MDKDIYVLRKELADLTKKLELISIGNVSVDDIIINFPLKIDVYNNYIIKDIEINSGVIGLGSRVVIPKSTGEIAGKIVRIKKDGTLMINRDGYATEYGISHSFIIRNLSADTNGIIERKKWLIKAKISELEWKIEKIINSKIFDLRVALSKGGIQLEDAKKIIQLKDFSTWYSAKLFETSIPLNKLAISHAVFICAIAKEYIKDNKDIKTYEILIDDKIE